MTASPLQGIRVVEVAEGVAGPFCGRMLAAFGADVIKVEPAPNGDRTRASEPRLPGVRDPLMIPGYQSEYMAGLHGYVGAMIALWKRSSTGVGGRVEVSEFESLAALHQFTTVMHTYSGLVRSRHGARWEDKGAYGRYPITVLPSKDGYVEFAVSTEGQWELLFPMVGRAELLDESRFETITERREHADEIDSILIDWMKDKTRADVFEFAAGTWSEPASPLLEIGEVLEDRQLAHRGLFAEVEHPDAGSAQVSDSALQDECDAAEIRACSASGRAHVGGVGVDENSLSPTGD